MIKNPEMPDMRVWELYFQLFNEPFPNEYLMDFVAKWRKQEGEIHTEPTWAREPTLSWTQHLELGLTYDSDEPDAVGPAELDDERAEEETDTPPADHHPAGRTEARPGELRDKLYGQHPACTRPLSPASQQPARPSGFIY